MKAIAHSRLFVSIMGMLIALAWLTLWAWEASPYGRYLDHGELADIDLEGVGGVMTTAILYVVGWTLMTVAMMLPTTLPLLDIFNRLTIRRPDHPQLMALVVVGYLGVWLAFGVIAHIADSILHEAFEHIAWLQANAWVFGAGPLLLAGVFQFTPLKHRCLDKCRTPLSFVMQRWRGSRERTHAFLLGVQHGAFCVGCCWALMAALFVFGVMNIHAIAILSTAVLLEKLAPARLHVDKIIGLGCILLGVWRFA
ncbi:MAG: DUF2182 domain-containing protein [Lysobacterales bacterium]|nr:MAG: DUF2182 domain-containing protein [Xanthomonadales bacterium]